MMLSEGVDPSEESKKAKVFLFAQMFLAHHVNALFKAGLVRIHDGVSAVAAPELGAAVHAAFNSDPPPNARDVSVESVISAAKLIKSQWEG